MLPRCAILLNDTRLDPARLFRPGLAGVALEVGFGGGEHLAVLAREKPDWGFLGCEPYLNGVAQLLVKIEEARLDNIRLYRGDARDVIERLPHASLDAVYVLFPDPWPKRRHWKRRFVAPEMLSSLARVMRGGGELRIATDSGAYVQWTLEKILTEPSFTWLASGPINWRARPQGAPETRYEAKARRAGRPIYHLRFERVRAGP
jgi:tRNA (guanine-N7-)-methyltransferase